MWGATLLAGQVSGQATPPQRLVFAALQVRAAEPWAEWEACLPRPLPRPRWLWGPRAYTGTSRTERLSSSFGWKSQVPRGLFVAANQTLHNGWDTER